MKIVEFLSSPPASLIWQVALLGMLVAVGWYVVARFRDAASEDKVSTNELLTNFRELHSRGELSDAEFRTIKTQLAAQLQDEIKDSDKKG